MILPTYLLLVGGFVAWLLGEVRFLVVAYRHGLAWFFACLFIPLAGLIFFALHFRETWRPMALATAGFLVAGLGYWLGGFDFLL